MSELARRESVGGGGELEVVDAFEARALTVAASAAAPNTRRAYAGAYRMFAAFLRAHYGEACVETFTVAAAAAWRDQLQAQGLAPSSVAPRLRGPTPRSLHWRRPLGRAGALQPGPAGAPQGTVGP